MGKHRKDDEVPPEIGQRAADRLRRKLELYKSETVEDEQGYSIRGKTTRKTLKNQEDGTTDARGDHR